MLSLDYALKLESLSLGLQDGTVTLEDFRDFMGNEQFRKDIMNATERVFLGKKAREVADKFGIDASDRAITFTIQSVIDNKKEDSYILEEYLLFYLEKAVELENGGS